MPVTKLCTQIPVPDGLRELADTLAINENPLNGHQIRRRRKNAAPLRGGEGFLELALPVSSLWLVSQPEPLPAFPNFRSFSFRKAADLRARRGNGRTLRVKILNGTPKIKAKIRQYASVWTQYANIHFDFVDDADAEIRVNVDNSGQSWSRVGTGCLAVSPDQPTMNFGWLTDSTPDDEFSRVIVHEFGHAVGCIHEHQSPAAGIPWNRTAVEEYYMRTQGSCPSAFPVPCWPWTVSNPYQAGRPRR